MTDRQLPAPPKRDPLWKTLVPLAVLIVAAVLYLTAWRGAASDCADADGTLVRGVWWWECVEEGEH